jgi:hypothetical protein
MNDRDSGLDFLERYGRLKTTRYRLKEGKKLYIYITLYNLKGDVV